MMSRERVFVLTLLAIIAFAGNSLLCRLALKQTGIDAASFTFIRILSGTVVLWLIVRLRRGTPSAAGSRSSVLGKSITPRLLIASAAILGGVALIILAKPRDG